MLNLHVQFTVHDAAHDNLFPFGYYQAHGGNYIVPYLIFARAFGQMKKLQLNNKRLKHLSSFVSSAVM